MEGAVGDNHPYGEEKSRADRVGRSFSVTPLRCRQGPSRPQSVGLQRSSTSLMYYAPTLKSCFMSVTSNKSQHPLGFGRPATYRIVLQGILSAEWSDRLAGLSIATTNPETGPTRNILEERIHDQAELERWCSQQGFCRQ